MSAALLLFAVLAVLALGGAFFLLAEGRRTISLAAGYLGIGLALSGIMLLGGGLFAAIFLFVLSMATAVVLLFFSVCALDAFHSQTLFRAFIDEKLSTN